MNAYEQGYARTMKLAGLKDWLARVPESFKGIRGSYQDVKRLREAAPKHLSEASAYRTQLRQSSPGMAQTPLTEMRAQGMPDQEILDLLDAERAYTRRSMQGAHRDPTEWPEVKADTETAAIHAAKARQAYRNYMRSQQQLGTAQDLFRQQALDVGGAVAAPVVLGGGGYLAGRYTND